MAVEITSALSLNQLRIGTRESPLARRQTDMVCEALGKIHPNLSLHILPFKTHGDRFLNAPLHQLSGVQGVFVKELEEALLANTIDVAVHSLKDMPSRLPDGLRLCSFSAREDPRDTLIFRVPGLTWETLPSGSRIGTSSVRRIARLQHLRPDLVFQPLRGNLQTRLQKLQEGGYEAILLAAAGLARMGYSELHTEVLDPVKTLIPAPCQGILALEYRAKDQQAIEELFAPCIDPNTSKAMAAERAFLTTLQGGCGTPMGAFAFPLGPNNTPPSSPHPTHWAMVGFLSHPDGSHMHTHRIEFDGTSLEACQSTGKQLAKYLLAQ